MSWCTIESDPGVFHEMISSLGVKDVAVEEIWSLDGISQAKEQSYGLVFLFKWVQESDPRATLDSSSVGDLIFARQTVQNACATQAILSVLLNAQNIELGETLSDFKSFIIDLDAESRGMAIGNSDQIRQIHNSFARAEPFFMEESRNARGKKEDVYHFVAYLPFGGRVYELDGLKAGPILLGEAGSDWLAVAKPAIEDRMNRYAATETHFALLNIRTDRVRQIETEIDELRSALEELTAANDESFTESINEMKTQIEVLSAELDDIRQERERQRQENIRRRHNYFPFINTLLIGLAKKGILPKLIANAKARQQQQREAQAKKK